MADIQETETQPGHAVEEAVPTPNPVTTPRLGALLRGEWSLFVSMVTALIFWSQGSDWFSGTLHDGRLVLLTVWLFLVVLASAFAVVRHADALAIQLGEPYGTLVLTLSVISIEVMMISAVMLTGSPCMQS
jgi:Ca2+:H+ antiporter